MIEVVFIDIDNTLLDFNQSSKLSVKKAFSNFGLPYKDSDYVVFKTINDQLWKKIERGELDRKGLHNVRFPLVLKELGVDFDGLKVETEFRKVLAQTACLVDGALETLKYLCGKYKVYGATNAIYDLQVNRLTSAGLYQYFSGLFVSEKIGHNKPTKEFFDYCFSNIDGLKPSQAVMVGDSLTADIIGGKDYGMTTVWYNHDKLDMVSDKADYKIDKLIDIKTVL